MRLVVGDAARQRGLAWLVALVLCLGPALADAQAQDGAAGGPASIASGGEAVLLRDQPGYEAAALSELANGSALDVTGEVVMAADGTAWVPVVAAGQSGYVPAGYVGAAPSAPPTDAAPAAPPAAAPDAAAPAPAGVAATTTSETNLRTAPSMDADVLLVLAPGTPVTVNGELENGFVPVAANGASGWVAVDLIAEGTAGAAPAAAPAPLPAPVTATSDAAPAEAERRARGESTGIGWPFAGGEWEVVQGYNNGTHTNRSGFAQYKYSLDWARVDGDSAGQQVYAPVSGTVRWTDRGSGGMLIDAGNGYGVAVFHVTIDRGLGRGDRVERGQPIGVISGPGGEGFMSMAHIDITCWRLSDNGQEATPFTGPNAIAGMEFPDTGGANQHMGARVTP
jgi:murein DD-endopeptidase MepM/ murein hydrolase activator NlpD